MFMYFYVFVVTLILFEVVLLSCFSEGYVLLTMLAGFIYFCIVH